MDALSKRLVELMQKIQTASPESKDKLMAEHLKILEELQKQHQQNELLNAGVPRLIAILLDTTSPFLVRIKAIQRLNEQPALP